MRCLNKNKRTLSFKTYSGKTQITDSDGLRTGEYTKTYSSLYTTQMNISPASGVSSLEMFGNVTNYAKVAVTDDLACPMGIDSIVWIDKPTSGPHDYIVVQVAKSLNSIAYALREVEVRG